MAREVFYLLKEAKVLIERCRERYNTIRPHSSPGYRPPGDRNSDPAVLLNIQP